MLHAWATAYLFVAQMVTLAGYIVLSGHLVLLLLSKFLILLTGTHTLMTVSHMDLLRKNEEKLTDCLDLSVLLDYLMDGVLIPLDKENIESEITNTDKCTRLLRILRSKPDVCFYRFIDALNSTNQLHLAELLQPSGKKMF